MRSVSYKMVTAQEPNSFSLSARLGRSGFGSPSLAAVIFIIASMAIGSTAGRAAGLLELLFGNPAQVQQAAPVAASAATQNVEIAPKVRRKKSASLKLKTRHGVRVAKLGLAKPQAASSRAVCVRVSDGYFFPTGNSGNFAALQSACDVQCPNMETRLFLFETGSDKIEDAKDARNGALYSTISTSFAMPPLDKQAHGCHPLTQTASAVSGIFSDPTLKRGDLVVTKKGIRMFKGRNHFPYEEADFAALRNSDGIPKERLAMLTAMERSMATARW